MQELSGQTTYSGQRKPTFKSYLSLGKFILASSYSDRGGSPPEILHRKKIKDSLEHKEEESAAE